MMEVNKIIQGDALEVLKTFPDAFVDCVITSPPYWNLRDYNVEGQLGLEPTFQEYIQKLCAIFDEIKRVLKKEGTCFVNLGDTYSGNKEGKTDNKVSQYLKENSQGIHKKATIQEKCLCQIPARFAIAMTDRGWILRNKIIWQKPNAMPSSVQDRFTIDYEEILFFVKSKKYYFEPQRQPHKKVSVNTGSYPEAHFATFPPALIIPMVKAGCPKGGIVLDPFMGSGTVAEVAKYLGRNYLGIELNKSYIKLAENRLRQEMLL